MSKNSNYISTNRSKHYLKCHLIFVCKYRKKLLVGQLKDDMKQTLLNIANKSDFEWYWPYSIVRKLKQESTYHIWRSVHRNYLYTFFYLTFFIIFHIKKKTIFMSRRKLEEKDKKSKINLDINENLLNEVDKLLGGDKRSRLIEDLLKKYIEENKDKLE